jgi:hypothetical protein
MRASQLAKLRHLQAGAGTKTANCLGDEWCLYKPHPSEWRWLARSGAKEKSRTLSRQKARAEGQIAYKIAFPLPGEGGPGTVSQKIQSPA